MLRRILLASAGAMDAFGPGLRGRTGPSPAAGLCAAAAVDRLECGRYLEQ
jgi:hypothetical protein